MSNLRILFAAISAIVLFLYGLEAFSREIQAVGGETLRKWLGRLTESRWRAVVLGAVATAIIQSSSAVTSLTVALVDAGTMTLRSSLGVLLGANIGTTSNAWLVSLKLTGIGPFFIVFGTVLSAIPTRFRVLGKAAFYFGFIFFSLDLVSYTLKPLAQNPLFTEVLSRSSTPLMGVLAGMVVTGIVQSSSITTGLCILLVQQTLLPATAAIPIVIGANIGTTATALVASIKMQKTARQAFLLVGNEDWPFPVPLVKKGDKWSFDAKAGWQELLYRRIGANELDAIAICHGYVEAQHEYALQPHEGYAVNQYAQSIVSTPGKQDGLAWQNADGGWDGPIGEKIARAIEQGYTSGADPYHGYFFKILKGQGPAASLGTMDFVVKGLMIGGFALVAAPAEYGITGVRTFIVSHDGVVFDKDFGAGTIDEFEKMELFNPDKSWNPVPEEEE